MELNEEKLSELFGKVETEMGAAANGSLILFGDKLGLFKSLAASGPMNSTELADETNTAERYVREWLSPQAASGYITNDLRPKVFQLLQNKRLFLGMKKVLFLLLGRSTSLPLAKLMHQKWKKILNREVGLALGAQAGEKRLCEVKTTAGMWSF